MKLDKKDLFLGRMVITMAVIGAFPFFFMFAIVQLKAAKDAIIGETPLLPLGKPGWDEACHILAVIIPAIITGLLLAIVWNDDN